MLAALLLLATLAPRCDPPGEPPGRYTRAERDDTRARVRAVCRELGATPAVCAYLDASTMRESSGRAGIRHTKGPDENGLGALGLSLKWHAWQWPGPADPEFCAPEVSAIVAMNLIRRAITNFKAGDWIDVQSIYGGRWYCSAPGYCRPRFSQRSVDAICARMVQRGFSCLEPVRLRDLGRRVRRRNRRAYILEKFPGVLTP